MHILLSKQMTRRDFLVTLGSMLLGVIGITSIVKNMTSVLDSHVNPHTTAPTQGFGKGPYGA